MVLQGIEDIIYQAFVSIDIVGPQSTGWALRLGRTSWRDRSRYSLGGGDATGWEVTMVMWPPPSRHRHGRSDGHLIDLSREGPLKQ